MMDRFVSWFAVPVAVLICFGPAIIAWLIAERKSSGGPEQNTRDRK
jgi:hypothetical protein